jgi:hypothetical protein
MLDGLREKIKSMLRWRWRSSETGRFVTKDYAEKHPATTQRERAD